MGTRYPYPIFGQLPMNGRIGLFALSAVMMTISTAALKWLYGKVNGYEGVVTPKSGSETVKENGKANY